MPILSHEIFYFRALIKKLINELMVGEKGKKIRQKVVELKKKAEGTRPSGCSYMNLDKLIKELFLEQNYIKVILFFLQRSTLLRH